MPCSDTFFVKLSAVVLLKVAANYFVALEEDFKCYCCSIISFILNSG